MHENIDEDVIVVEAHPDAEAIDVWVMDDQAKRSDSRYHRSVVMDERGNILADEIVDDYSD